VSRAPGDGLPWYRHVWPWFVVGLLGVSVVGSLTIVFLAYDGRDPLVRENWYADGVSINDDLARLDLARRSGIRARVHFEPEREWIVVAMTGEGTDAIDALDLMFDHATRSEFDRQVRLERTAPGVYEAMLPELAMGRFYATLEPAAWALAPGTPPPTAWKLSRAFRTDASHTFLDLGGDG
jgi:hypothetical protein